MAKSYPNKLVWNVVFLLLILAVGVVSYQLFVRREGFDMFSSASKGSSEGSSEGSDVEKVKKGNGLLVVTMEKCPHCESMKEALVKLREDPSTKGRFAWADSKDASVSDLKLNSFPTILIFKNGEPTDYTDGRSYDELLAVIESTK
jgi:hypothetical protein